MILSMTGYGKSTAVYNGKKIHAEIKSLNSKALDLSTRIAPLYREKEMEIRQLIASQVERGKVDFNIWCEKDETQIATPVNKTLVAEYYRQLKALIEETGIPEPENWLPTLMHMPDVLSKTEVEELSEEEWAVAKSAIQDAIDQFIAFRKQEGEALALHASGEGERVTAPEPW